MATEYRIGADENGLGAQLGPLIVTAVLARADERGAKLLERRPPKWLSPDLDDSKRVVSHKNVRLGEAWTRAVAGPNLATPDELVQRVALETPEELRAPCPRHVERQCWSTQDETFEADDELVQKVSGHLKRLRGRGVEIVAVRSSILCTRRLNDALKQGHNRFGSDLHGMERLVLSLRDQAGSDVHAICGKVGGIGDYEKFFGPLSGRLRVTLEQSRKRSSYRFPGLGELHFVMDADERHPLVMLASLVGKYLRELLMARVARYYAEETDGAFPSGYHDPVTTRFIKQTELVRQARRVPQTCFLRNSAAGAGATSPARRDRAQ